MKVVGYSSYADLLVGKNYFIEDVGSYKKAISLAKKKAVLDSSYVVIHDNRGEVVNMLCGDSSENSGIWTFMPDNLKRRLFIPIINLAKTIGVSSGTIYLKGITSEEETELVLYQENEEVEGVFVGEKAKGTMLRLLKPLLLCIPNPVSCIIFPANIGTSDIGVVCYYKTSILSEDKQGKCNVVFEHDFNLPWLKTKDSVAYAESI